MGRQRCRRSVLYTTRANSNSGTVQLLSNTIRDPEERRAWGRSGPGDPGLMVGERCHCCGATRSDVSGVGDSHKGNVHCCEQGSVCLLCYLGTMGLMRIV